MSDELTHIGRQIESLTRATEVDLQAAMEQSPPRSIPVALVPSSTKVEDLERYLPTPARHRAAFETDSIDAFLTYAQHQGAGAESTVFVRHIVDSDRVLRARLFFDYGSDQAPSWRGHTATLMLERSVEGLELDNIDGSRGKFFTQRGLAEWMEDWREYLECWHYDEPVPFSDAIKAVRNLQIRSKAVSDHGEQDLKATRSAFEEVEAAASGDLKMPTRIAFSCKPYPELDGYVFRYRLSIRVDDDKAKDRYRLMPVQHDIVFDQILADFKEVIRGEFARLMDGNEPAVFVGWQGGK